MREFAAAAEESVVAGGTFNSREHLIAAMSDWPKAVGDHTVTDEWECTDCGADFDCLSQFRQTDCA